MQIGEMAQTCGWKLLAGEKGTGNEVDGCYVGDLLSWVMGRAKAGDAWLTVMGNISALAVASLADAACVILAEGMELDGASVKKAEEQGSTVFASEEPVFDTALEIYRMISGDGGL